MKAALRLVMISLIVVFTLVLGVFALRFIGLRQQPIQFRHPLLQGAPWVAQESGGEDVTFQLISLRWERERGWWAVTSAGDKPLEEVLKAGQGRPVLLDVQSLLPEDPTPLLKILDDSVGKERVAVMSSFGSVLNQLRKQQPFWLYAADSASLLRYQLFASLFLEPIIDIRADFVVAADLSPRLREELHRRKKKILLEAEQAKIPPGYDGVVVRSAAKTGGQ